MRRALLALVLGIILSAAGYTVAAWAQKPPEPPGKNPCEHGNSQKPCKEDPQPDHGADCDPHGKGGVNEDHCLDTTTTTTTTTDTTDTTTTTGPPPPPPPTTTETTTSTTPTTSTSPTTTQETTTTSDSTTIETQTTPTPPAGPSPPKSKPKPNPGPDKSPPTEFRMFNGKPHPIVRGSG